MKVSVTFSVFMRIVRGIFANKNQKLKPKCNINCFHMSKTTLLTLLAWSRNDNCFHVVWAFIIYSNVSQKTKSQKKCGKAITDAVYESTKEQRTTRMVFNSLLHGHFNLNSFSKCFCIRFQAFQRLFRDDDYFWVIFEWVLFWADCL